MPKKHSNVNKNLIKYAIKLLRESYEYRNICGTKTRIVSAGKNNFRELWARDFSSASLGILTIGDFSIVKEVLAIFYKFQKKDGQLPKGFYLEHPFKKYIKGILGIKTKKNKKMFPSYKTFLTKPIDSNSLIISTTKNYYEKTKDKLFILKFYHNMTLAIKWLENQDENKDILIEQGWYGDWADSLRRKGQVLCGNILYYRAVIDYAFISQEIGYTKKAKEYYEKAEKIKNKINEFFWDEHLGYYRESKNSTIFATFGNLLAILLDISSNERTEKILSFIKKKELYKPIPIKAAYPHYNFFKKQMITNIFGVYQYSKQSWQWIGNFYVAALAQTNHIKEALDVSKQIYNSIKKHGDFYEIFDKNGNPFKTFCFKSDKRFTMNIGTFIYSQDLLNNKI